MTSSPTPAVLPDARARLVKGSKREELREALRKALADHMAQPDGNERPVRLSLWPEHVRAIVGGPIATPPASDAAVPAGACKFEFGQCVRCGRQQGPLAVAPKVSSDTGAGLRPAAETYARLLAAKQIDALIPNCDPTHRLAMIEKDYPGWISEGKYIAEALATDATDGATGGAEVQP